MTIRWCALVLVLAAFGGCSSDYDGPVADPPAVTPLVGFASGTVLIVSSEQTQESLAVLCLDPASGEVGMLPGSPADVDATIGDVESLAADPGRRRVFFGSDLSGAIAVCDLDAAGMPVPVAGSPFPAERTAVSVIQVAPSGDTIYVGYHAAGTVSRYDVDAAGALTLAQSISTGTSSFIETMLLSGDVLYVGFRNSSNIVGFRLDAGGAFATDGSGDPVLAADVATNQRPDYLVAQGDKLYCSLTSGSIDAFTIEADGSLTRLPGSPYAFPGLGAFELIAIQPGGAHIAVGAELPSAAVGLYAINADGSLTPTGDPLVIHGRVGGPEGIVFSADGRFIFLCDHIGQGLYVLEVTGSVVDFAATPRYELPGRQIDVLRLELPVAP